MRKAGILPAILIAMLLALLPLPAAAQEFPALSGRVVDQANLLQPAEEQALSAKLEALEKQSQRQLVVATINDLGGYDIADYGYQLGRNWGIGDKERNDGALLIIAPTERKVRIEVGYGLEAYLTDALSSQIIRRDITPKFKAGDMAGGINAGVDSMIAQLTLPPEEATKIAKEAASRAKKGDDGSAVFFWLFIFVFFIWPIILSRKRGGRKHRRKGGFAAPIIWGGGGSRSGGFSGGFGGGGGSFGGGGASGGW